MNNLSDQAKKQNALDQAYNIIQHLILSMQIKPGEVVTENSLSDQLGIGRTPVREALKKLEQEGLIETENRRKRVYVLTIREVSDIFDIKIKLESAVACWAAERGKIDDKKNLERTLGNMKKIAVVQPADDKEEEKMLNDWLELDRQLHHILFQMADNRKVEQIISNLNKQWHRLRVGIYAMEGRINRSFAEHQLFVEAVIEGKPAVAEEAMKIHLENLKKELVKILKLFHYPG
jgi:DNA-binding GntR family transcriptional regulator